MMNHSTLISVTYPSFRHCVYQTLNLDAKGCYYHIVFKTHLFIPYLCRIRLVIALKTLHELCTSAPPYLESAQSIPAFIRTLSNCIWKGKQSDFLNIPNELFR